MIILRHSRVFLLVAVLSLILAFWWAAPVDAEPDSSELIVKLKRSGDRNTTVASLRRTVGAQILDRDEQGGLMVVRPTPGVDVDLLATRLAADPAVEYVEPNHRAWALGFPNDPLWSSQWNFRQIKAPAAWRLAPSPGQGVTVAVLDTGVAYEDRVEGATNYRRLPDLAGTAFVPGYDFVNRDSHPNDDEGHGTHVAGVIAQTTNNALGTAGLAYAAKIMPVKVLDSHGFGTAYDIAAGIRWAADRGAKVINLSLGLQGFSRTVEDALVYARNKQVTIVAAAGNGAQSSGYSGGLIYPASSSRVISVGAVGYDSRRAAYSQFGGGLDLVAPGGTTMDQNNDGYDDGILQQTIETDDPSQFTYYWIIGTSQAAPHVSAVAAMLIARGVRLPDDVYRALIRSAQDLGTKGFDKYYGYGLLDAYGALTFKQTSTEWYFAEGFTADHFSTKILISNPANSIAKVRATFSKPGGDKVVRNYNIQAKRRTTIHVDSVPGLGATGVSTKLESTNGVGIVAERAMYFNYRGRRGGHATIGATAPARRWYLAEGSTNGAFDTQLLVYNPGASRARIEIVFTKGDGGVVVENTSIPAGGRRKVLVDDIAGMGSAEFATAVRVLSGPNVVVERSMYFGYGDIAGGHSTLGVVKPQTKWLFAEGTTRGSFETWVLVQNPAKSNAVVEATFTRPDGHAVVRRYKLLPGRRRTISVNSLSGLEDTDVAIKVEALNGISIVVERAVYFNHGGRRGGHVTVGARAPQRTWYFADGYTGGEYETWLLLSNPRASASKVVAEMTRPDGRRFTKTVIVPAGTRRTISVDSLPGLGNAQFATKLSTANGVPFVAEKAVYFGHNGWDGGHATIGYYP